MADTKVSDLTAITTPVAADLLHVVDVSLGQNSKITFANLQTALGFISDITGEDLSSLADVTIASIATGELLTWNGSAWINETLSEAGIAAAVHTHVEADITDLGSYAAAVHTHVEADITDLGTYLTDLTAEDLTTLADVAITGAAQGDILHYDGSEWVNLAPGTSGHFLKTQGAAADPVWASIPGGGDMLASTYDVAGHASQVLTEANTQTVTNKTLDADSNNVSNIGLAELAANVSTMLQFFNGTFLEGFDATVSSNGTVVTMSIEQSGGGDLTAQFSDGFHDYDCTPADTIVLTAGTDTVPQANYVYILQSAPTTLVLSTTSWPSAEHAKVSYFLIPSAVFVQSTGCYVCQNWNDEAANSVGQGHLSHIAARSRRLGALYVSGVAGDGTEGYLTPTSGNVELKSTSGVVAQMHNHTVPAFDTSVADVVLVKNWSGTAYHDITNLHDIVDDSTGSAINNNRRFNLVLWGVANKTGGYQPMVINLPSGTYANLSNAIADGNGYDDYEIPSEFDGDSSTGYLIARITVKMGATWTVEATQDLRGSTPYNISSSGMQNLVEDVTPQLGGELDVNGFGIGGTSPVVATTEAEFQKEAHFGAEIDNGNSGASDTIDWTEGNKQSTTMTADCTYSFTAPTGACNLILRIIQNGTGGWEPTWPGTVKWPGGVAPTLSVAAAAIDIVSFYYDGTSYHGQAGLAFA